MEFVSNSLIGAILACDGMIYMNEGVSDRSFWVAFERDYALRAEKPVFSYTPSRNTFSRHTAPPLDLAVFASYSRVETYWVESIIDFMRKRRHFDVFTYNERFLSGTNFLNIVDFEINNTIERGGYMVTFWGAYESEWIMRETLIGLERKRVIVAGLGANAPDFIEDHQDKFVQLMESGQIINNHIDDLIVRLYWLIFQNQFPELVYE